MRRIILLSCVALFGCGATPQPKVELVDTQSFKQHPQLPAPIYCSELNLDQVNVGDGKVIVNKEALAEIMKCNINVLNYVGKAETIFCFYRSELNEERCESYRNAVTTLRGTSAEK